MAYGPPCSYAVFTFLAVVTFQTLAAEASVMFDFLFVGGADDGEAQGASSNGHSEGEAGAYGFHIYKHIDIDSH